MLNWAIHYQPIVQEIHRHLQHDAALWRSNYQVVTHPPKEQNLRVILNCSRID